MNDEQAIYEWLYGVKVEKRSNGYCGLYVDEMDRPFWLRLPSLDMNTAFGECIPKLQREGVRVLCWANRAQGEYVPPVIFALHVVMFEEAPYKDTDFYVALTEYLEDKRGH